MSRDNSTGRGGSRSKSSGGPSKRTSKTASGKRIGKSKVVEKSAPKKEFKPRKDFGKKPVKKQEASAPKPKLKTLSAEGMRLNRFMANAGVCSRR